MPIFEVRKLQLSLKIKTSISFMFLLAGLYVIPSKQLPLALGALTERKSGFADIAIT